MILVLGVALIAALFFDLVVKKSLSSSVFLPIKLPRVRTNEWSGRHIDEEDIIQLSLPYFVTAAVKILLVVLNIGMSVGIVATAAVFVTQLILYQNNKRPGPDTVPTTTAVTTPTIGSTPVRTPAAQRPTTGAGGGGIGNGAPSVPFGNEPTGVVARPTNTPTVTPSSTPSPSPTRPPTITPIPTRPPLPPVDASKEQELFFFVNERRPENSCAYLTYSPELNAAARRHAIDMATNNIFQNEGTDGSTVDSRIRDSGYTNSKRGNGSSGWWRQIISRWPPENSSPASLVNDLVSNDDYRKILLDCEYRDMGVSYARGSDGFHYWVILVADGIPLR